MQSKTYYQNPDFDEVFLFFDEEISSSKDAFKLVDGTEYYEKSPKANAQAFIKRIQEKLLAKKKHKWPYTQPLMIFVGLSGIKKLYGEKDLDNILKSVFDAFKGIVFVDDAQIHLVIASKQIWKYSMKGFAVGIRILPPDPQIDKYVPALLSNSKEYWGESWEKKFGEKSDEKFSSLEIY